LLITASICQDSELAAVGKLTILTSSVWAGLGS
jgi:hypothetical protein